MLTRLLIYATLFYLVFSCKKKEKSEEAMGDSPIASIDFLPLYEEWRSKGFCMATFTAPAQGKNSFGEVLFNFNANETFLISKFPMFNENNFANSNSRIGLDHTILVVDQAGFLTVDVDNSQGVFTSECTKENSEASHGVFLDTVLYSDKELTKEVCTLTKGLSGSWNLSINSAINSGDLGNIFKSVSQGNVPEELKKEMNAPSQTNELIATNLPEGCGALEKYFIRVNYANRANSRDLIFPIHRVLKKKAEEGK